MNALGCTALENASDVLHPERLDAGRDKNDVKDAGASEDAEVALDASSEEGGTEDCIDESGFGGLGCYRCEPTDLTTLENACSDITCVPFARRMELHNLTAEGELPELPEIPFAPRTRATERFVPQLTDAGADTSCQGLTATATVVYVTGSSAAKPFLQQVAQQIAGEGIYLVYTSTGSCVGVDAIVNGTPMTSGAAPAPVAKATYWSHAASEGEPCDLPAEGVLADIGISDVFAQSCPGFELSNLDNQQIRDAHGPIQTMTFAVPAASPYFEFSAQAAYFVFGFGKDGGIYDAELQGPAWDDEELIFQRSASSGTQAMLAAAIGVSAERWRGKVHATSEQVAAALRDAGATRESAQRAIGILAADYIESRGLRGQVRVLAFQDTEQPCAVYPDSTETAHDKRNVRDGHYPLWGPLHLLHRVDAEQRPENPSNRRAVSDILGYLSGTRALPNGTKLIDLYAQNGLVPECAMKVTRGKDGGNIMPKKSENPCSCLFEMRATGATDCTPCKVQGDCENTEVCSLGYCEP